MTMECDRTSELLPWLLNDSLEPEEKRAVEEHLESCSSCHGELEQALRVAQIASQHVPAEILTEYAFGSPIESSLRSTLEIHLAHCESCQEELRLTKTAATASVSEPVTPETRRTFWLPTAVAAALILGLGTGILWQTGRTSPRTAPEGNVALIELIPESLALRGSGPPQAIPEGRPATLVLVTDLTVGAADYRVRLVSLEDKTLWQVSDLLPAPDGTVVIHIPLTVRAPAGAFVVLETATVDGWNRLETYRLEPRP